MDRAEIKEAMGDWLGELAPWDVFATWTFARPVSAAGAMNLARRYVGILPKQKMMTRVMVTPKGRPAFFWGADLSCREISSLKAAGVAITIPKSGDTWLSLPEMGAQALYGFMVAERGGSGGLIHLHALLGNVGALQTDCGYRFPLPPGEWGKACCMVHSWPRGIARVLDYDPQLGAKHYVSKYITKELAEWELFKIPGHPQKVIAF